VNVATDPEELLRSIERTREEVALTVDTIAARLDPKRAAKRSIGVLRSSVTGAVDGARDKLRLGAFHAPDVAASAESSANGGSKSAAVSAKQLVGAVRANAKRVPKPAVGGGLAALVAFAAVLAWRRRRR